MRTKLLAAATAIAALGSVSLDALAQAKPDVLVKQRQAAMTLQGKYLGPIGAMMKGAAPGMITFQNSACSSAPIAPAARSHSGFTARTPDQVLSSMGNSAA